MLVEVEVEAAFLALEVPVEGAMVQLPRHPLLVGQQTQVVAVAVEAPQVIQRAQQAAQV